MTIERVSTVLVILTIVLAGCSAVPTDQAAETTTETTASTTTTTTMKPTLTTTTTTKPTLTTTTTTPTTEESSPAKGTMYLSVVRLENQSSYREWSADERAQLRELPDDKREEVLTVLKEGAGQTQIRTDAWSYYNEGRVKVVKYNGTWYYVRISIV